MGGPLGGKNIQGGKKDGKITKNDLKGKKAKTQKKISEKIMRGERKKWGARLAIGRGSLGTGGTGGGKKYPCGKKDGKKVEKMASGAKKQKWKKFS
jgi:hypothetical protein